MVGGIVGCVSCFLCGWFRDVIAVGGGFADLCGLGSSCLFPGYFFGVLGYCGVLSGLLVLIRLFVIIVDCAFWWVLLNLRACGLYVGILVTRTLFAFAFEFWVNLNDWFWWLVFCLCFCCFCCF